MENEHITSITLTEELIQWVVFFAVMATFLFPAFKFRNLAIAHNKKGWVYFIIGLASGYFGFNLGQLIVIPLRIYFVPPEYVAYLISILFLSAYFFYRFSYKYLESYFIGNRE